MKILNDLEEKDLMDFIKNHKDDIRLEIEDFGLLKKFLKYIRKEYKIQKDEIIDECFIDECLVGEE